MPLRQYPQAHHWFSGVTNTHPTDPVRRLRLREMQSAALSQSRELSARTQTRLCPTPKPVRCAQSSPGTWAQVFSLLRASLCPPPFSRHSPCPACLQGCWVSWPRSLGPTEDLQPHGVCRGRGQWWLTGLRARDLGSSPDSITARVCDLSKSPPQALSRGFSACGMGP